MRIKSINPQPIALVFVMCIGLISLISPSFAKDDLTPKLTMEGRGAQLAFYHSSCGEESAHECVVVDVGCTEPGQFKATVYGMSAKEAGHLFLNHKGNANIVVNEKRLDFLVRKVEYNDMDSDWSADFDDLPQASALWNSILISGIASISVGNPYFAPAHFEICTESFPSDCPYLLKTKISRDG